MCALQRAGNVLWRASAHIKGKQDCVQCNVCLSCPVCSKHSSGRGEIKVAGEGVCAWGRSGSAKTPTRLSMVLLLRAHSGRGDAA